MTTLASARAAMSGKIARIAVAAVAAGGALVAVEAASSAPAGAASYEAATKVNNVAIRPCAHRSNKTCKPNGYIDISGSIFTVTCYVSGDSVSGDKIWYHGGYRGDPYIIVYGYVSGYNLDTGHDPRKGIPHC